MCKRVVSCLLVLVLGVCCLCPLSVAAYSSITETNRTPINPFSVTSDVDGLVVLNMFFFSQSDTITINSPEKLAEVSFNGSGVWNGSDTLNLSSSSLYDQANIGYSISDVYESSSKFFVYCLSLSVPVSAGDSFSVSAVPSSYVYSYSQYCRMYTLPGVSALRRVYCSTSDSSYTLKSDNQHLVFAYIAYPATASWYYSSTNPGQLSTIATGSTNLDPVYVTGTGAFGAFTTSYGLSSGSDIGLVFKETKQPFDFSVFECLTGVEQSGGSMDAPGGSGGDNSGGSSFDDSNIISSILALPERIGNFFADALSSAVNTIRSFLEDLFIPDPELINKEVELLHSKFIWYESVKDLVNDVVENIIALDGQEPGQVYLNIPSNNSLTFGGLGGSKPIAIDLSWFAAYRSTVHLIFSAFLWIMYVWRLLHILPGIINGAAGAAGAIGSASSSFSSHAPSEREILEQETRAGNFDVDVMANKWADYYSGHWGEIER